jgi:3-hydroxyisobutyrate dehydrogenase
MTSSQNTTTVAFIGLGRMGAPMALNLHKAGYRVVGYDIFEPARAAVAANGIEVSEALGDAARDASIVITMLQNGGQVQDCYSGEGGLLTVCKPGTLFIDSSTIDVFEARALHDAAEQAGHRALDAPVSGGVVGAEAGTLTLMVGGSEADFAAAEELLLVLGKRAVHCGAAGSGQAAKCCNNMILGVSMIAVSEAFVLAERLGLSHQAMFDVASTSSGQCWALTTNCPVPGPVPASPANNDYKPGFAVNLMLKDLRLANDAAKTSGTPTALGHHAADIYAHLADDGAGMEDFSAIYRSLSALAESADGAEVSE